MLIAIVSDTHNRTSMIVRALALIADRDVDHILHCGDIDDPDAVALFPAKTHFVFGNCDIDRQGTREAIEKIGATLHEPFGHVRFDGLDIGFIHSDDRTMFRDLERSDAFDFLFYGHSHVAEEHRTGKTRVVNPGALHRASRKTFVILDTATGKLESIEVADT